MADVFVSLEEPLIPALPNEIALECLLRVPHQFHSTLTSVCHSWRIICRNPSFYRERRRRGTAERLLCLIQPTPTPPTPQPLLLAEKSNGKAQEVNAHGPPLYGLSIYNATQRNWRRIELKNSLIPMFCQCVALPESGQILLIGGWDPETLEPVADVIVIDLISGFWRRGAKMTVARSFFACAAVGGSKVYVAGGHDAQKNAFRSAEVYDVAMDEWRVLPEMAEERDECQGICFQEEGKFWVFSGYGTENQGRFRSDAEFFDPENEIWSKIDSVWPFPNSSPRTTVSLISGHRRWWRVAREEQDGKMEVKEFDWEERRWRTRNTISLPAAMTGSSLVAVDGGDGMLVMGNTVAGGEGDGDGKGEGVLMVEGGGEAWRHVQTPSRFTGLPFSGSCLII